MPWASKLACSPARTDTLSSRVLQNLLGRILLQGLTWSHPIFCGLASMAVRQFTTLPRLAGRLLSVHFSLISSLSPYGQASKLSPRLAALYLALSSRVPHWSHAMPLGPLTWSMWILGTRCQAHIPNGAKQPRDPELCFRQYNLYQPAIHQFVQPHYWCQTFTIIRVLLTAGVNHVICI